MTDALHQQRYSADPGTRLRARVLKGYAQQRLCGRGMLTEVRLGVSIGLRQHYAEMQRAAFQDIEDARRALEALEA
jgi:hypothetical protein